MTVAVKKANDERLVVRGIIIGIEASKPKSFKGLRKTLQVALEQVEVKMGIREPRPAERWSI